MNQKKNCETCGNFDLPICISCTCKYDEPPTKWVPSEQYTPMSNADRIRAMSDEELAEWMVQCNAYGERAEASQWLPWLQQPCEGGADDE